MDASQIEALRENHIEAMKLLSLIVAEFQSDPMSVACFDLRIVERAKQCVAKRVRLERSREFMGERLLTEDPNEPRIRRAY